MDPETKAQVLIGNDAEEFVESELGRTMLGMAEQDLKTAIIKFDECPISDNAKLMDLKVEIRACRRFEQYLTELITRGREAFEAHKQQQE